MTCGGYKAVPAFLSVKNRPAFLFIDNHQQAGEN